MQLIGKYDWAELEISGKRFHLADDGEFEVPASELSNQCLSELPRGASLRLCERVIGSKDLYGRNPDCIFCHDHSGELIAKMTTAFFSTVHSILPAERHRLLREQLTAAYRGVWPLVEAGRVIGLEKSSHDEIAYLTSWIRLEDQPILDAELFLAEIEGRLVQSFTGGPTLFLCHASEDKDFAQELVTKLEERALYAWFDRREILVGDSITERINEALAETRFVLVILSPRSVKKPWVQRELNSSLMRQLSDAEVSVLPILLETCDLPPLLADLKYADFTTDFDQGLDELLEAVRGSRR